MSTKPFVVRKRFHYGYIRATVIDRNDHYDHKYLNFYHDYNDFVNQIATLLDIDFEDAEKQPVYLPYCDNPSNGFKNGCMHLTFSNAKDAHNYSLTFLPDHATLKTVKTILY